MLTPRRAGLLIGALATALATALWQPAPDDAAATHGSAPAGQYWASGTTATTWLWEHINIWSQPCTGRGCRTSTNWDTTRCRPRAATPESAQAEGCGGHQRPGWTWDRHGCGTATTAACRNLGEAIQTCAARGGAVVSDASHCGTWTACGDDEIVNSAGDGCEDAPPAPPPTSEDPPDDPPDDDDDDDGGTETVTPPPPTPTPPPGQVCTTWVDGECINWATPAPSGPGAGGSRPCNGRDRTWPQSKTYDHKGVHSSVRRAYDRTTRAYVSTPTPFQIPGGGLRGWPWSPDARPTAGAHIIGGAMSVAAWRSDFTGEDRPRGWYQETGGGGGIFTYGHPTRHLQAMPGPSNACGKVTIRSRGAGWRLVNVTLADETAPTSGTGRGARAFAGASITDDSKAAGFSVWEEWDVIVELYPTVGQPYPPCTPAELAAQPARTYQPRDYQIAFRVWDTDFTGWRPTGAASARSCGWTVKIWSAVPLRPEPCPGGVVPDNPEYDEHGHVLHCVYAGV